MRKLWLSILLLCAATQAQTFVQQHGRLQVQGSALLDQNGDTIALRGMSMFWSQWCNFYNGAVMDWLVSDWKINLVRAAMGVNGTADGYLVTPSSEKAKVDTIVAAAVRNGIYVIIDWHDSYANQHTADAKVFFAEMAAKYANVPNVIWEIWNEPMDTVSWLNDIKPYAEAVIPEIRKSSSNLVIVGTRTWSQRVDEVIGHTIQDANVAYTFHFYVGSHGQPLRDIGDKAINAGIPIFVTEWGIWDNGYIGGDHTQAVDLTQVLAWTDWMDSHKLSSAMWAVNDKDESSDALASGASPLGAWAASDLTTAGTFGRSYIRGMNTGTWVRPTIPPTPIDTIALPGRLEAEAYSNQSGIQREKSQDIDGTGDIGYIENGDYVEYVVQVSSAATYPIAVRYASAGLGGTLKISIDGGTTLTSVTIPTTGDWQVWDSVKDSLTLPAGLHTLRLDFVGAAGGSLYNLNYIDIGTSPTQVITHKRTQLNVNLQSHQRFDLLGRHISSLR